MDILVAALMRDGLSALGNLLYNKNPPLGRTMAFLGIVLVFQAFLIWIPFDAGQWHNLNRQDRLANRVTACFSSNPLLKNDGGVSRWKDSATLYIQKINNQDAVIRAMDNALITGQHKAAIVDNAREGLAYCSSLISIFLLLICVSLKMEVPGSSAKNSPAWLSPLQRKAAIITVIVTLEAFIVITAFNSGQWFNLNDQRERISKVQKQFPPDRTAMLRKDSGQYYQQKNQNEKQVLDTIQKVLSVRLYKNAILTQERKYACWCLLAIFFYMIFIWQPFILPFYPPSRIQS